MFVLLKAMFMFVCLKRLVIFLTFGLWYVNIAHFMFSFFVVLLCVYSGSYCSALWFMLFPILSVIFLLLVGVTAFC